MNTENLNKIQGTFVFYETDEKAILDILDDENVLKLVLDILERISTSGALKTQTPFIKVDEKQKCLIINMLLHSHVTLQRLSHLLDIILKTYENSTLDKFMANDGSCSYRLEISKKNKPYLVFNMVHPLLLQYDLIPTEI